MLPMVTRRPNDTAYMQLDDDDEGSEIQIEAKSNYQDRMVIGKNLGRLQVDSTTSPPINIRESNPIITLLAHTTNEKSPPQMATQPLHKPIITRNHPKTDDPYISLT